MTDIVDEAKELIPWLGDDTMIERLTKEVERLREENAELIKVLKGLFEAVKWEKVSAEVDAARKALEGK